MGSSEPACAAHDLVLAYVEHAPFVERVLRRAGVAERDVPDARQDVFVVAHRKLAGFEGRGRLSTWLYRIAWNVASEYRRRACHRHEQLGDAALDAETDASQALRLEHRELLSHALRALDELDDDKREAFLLSEVVGLSMREVARRAGCPLKTAFSRAYAARRRVLAALREQGVVFGLVPALAPLRFQRLQRAALAPRATPPLAAHAQLALLSLACATLPALSLPLPLPAAPELARASAPHGPACAALAPAPARATASRRVPASFVASYSRARRARVEPSQRRTAARVATHAIDAPPPATQARERERFADLIVVRDGAAWLVPATAHPLDRLPADRPLLPPFVLVRGPRRDLGSLSGLLPALSD